MRLHIVEHVVVRAFPDANDVHVDAGVQRLDRFCQRFNVVLRHQRVAVADEDDNDRCCIMPKASGLCVKGVKGARVQRRESRDGIGIKHAPVSAYTGGRGASVC